MGISTRYNKGVPRHVEAIFEHGILRPLEPLALAENQRVRLTVESEPEQAPKPYNERREEMRWLSEQSRAYPGEWVALDGPRLIAHGFRLAEVSAAAEAAGVSQPLFASIPSDPETPFAGW